MDGSLNLHRQSDVVDGDRIAQTKFTVIGAGAIGSCVALGLAKCGARTITVYDDDRIEDHNLPNQWYRMGDIGKLKVTALAEVVKDFTGVEIVQRRFKFTGKQWGDVVLCCVDSIEARKTIWSSLHANDKVFPMLYVDARMGAEVGSVWCVSVPSHSAYAATLDTTDVFRAACTAKATMYCATGLASLVVAQVAQWCSGREYRDKFTIDFRNTMMV